jgi:hypothetical protein
MHVPTDEEIQKKKLQNKISHAERAGSHAAWTYIGIHGMVYNPTDFNRPEFGSNGFNFGGSPVPNTNSNNTFGSTVPNTKSDSGGFDFGFGSTVPNTKSNNAFSLGDGGGFSLGTYVPEQPKLFVYDNGFTADYPNPEIDSDPECIKLRLESYKDALSKMYVPTDEEVKMRKLDDAKNAGNWDARKYAKANGMVSNSPLFE